jgi:hypothetical protein
MLKKHRSEKTAISLLCNHVSSAGFAGFERLIPQKSPCTYAREVLWNHLFKPGKPGKPGNFPVIFRRRKTLKTFTAGYGKSSHKHERNNQRNARINSSQDWMP